MQQVLDNLRNDCNSTNPYRLTNGVCNNLNHKWWGRSSTHYQRFAPAAYDDSFSSPRTRSTNGSTLPNPRFLASNVLPPNPQMSSLSQAFIFFGQFVAHDLVRNSFGIKECLCGSKDPLCFNIQIPNTETSPGFSNQSCIPLRRNLQSKSASECNVRHREQFNLRSHYLDNSNIYGSSDADLSALRLGQNGLLKTSDLPNSNFEGLPVSNLSICSKSNSLPSFGCFFSGDDKVESNVYLTSINTVN